MDQMVFQFIIAEGLSGFQPQSQKILVFLKGRAPEISIGSGKPRLLVFIQRVIIKEIFFSDLGEIMRRDPGRRAL